MIALAIRNLIGFTSILEHKNNYLKAHKIFIFYYFFHYLWFVMILA